MFKKMILFIKGAAKAKSVFDDYFDEAKAFFDAIDDDIDLDGKRETDELRDCLDNCIQLGKDLVNEAKKGYSIAVILFKHCLTEMRNAK